MHVLYVDDDRVNLMLFEHACSAIHGLRLSTADSGADALDTAAIDPPDLFVIDLHLCGTSGHEVLGKLRALPGLHAVPAYLCTADESDEVRAAAREAGFAGFWAKPVGIQMLRAELAALDPTLAG